jgi:hypothetical protein
MERQMSVRPAVAAPAFIDGFLAALDGSVRELRFTGTHGCRRPRGAAPVHPGGGRPSIPHMTTDDLSRSPTVSAHV